MNAHVTQILNAIKVGDSSRAEGLIPLVYEELRKLASARMARERAGQTLQPTALVHEAFLSEWLNRNLKAFGEEHPSTLSLMGQLDEGLVDAGLYIEPPETSLFNE